jgi:2'-5' RNA ligase
MDMHRLFVALRPPPDFRKMCLSAMTRGPGGWAWQDDEQLHITLRFIGEVEVRMAEDIAQALQTLRAPAPQVQLSGVGIFDHGARSALFARVTRREPLEALHRKVDRLLVQCGLEPERRAYLPHITLARRRSRSDDPQRWLEEHADLTSSSQHVGHVTLYESILGKHGATYEPIARYPLDSAAGNPI